MPDKALIQGDYTDLKFIKTRKVAVISIEIPIERASAFFEAFGTPDPATGTPVAIARLTKEAAASAEKKSRTWSELSRAEQAGMKCHDPEFQRFLGNEYAVRPITDEKSAAEIVKSVCGVKSRSDLNRDRDAADLWDTLYSNFQLHQRGAAA